ncbi:glycosyltransferase family 2 protein [Pseudomonas juntendi]|uniref:glycosyltransferase family 2 protein n=1 Tax=Pseudomonas juntendi TaxID=2666183 RepID=UPI001F313FC3|nr:glycosyltransferase family 2 protein [Pseudomonas juntendi]
MVKEDNNLKIGICSIFKNEGPYILEWLAYHRIIGVEQFFIADNDSTDDGKKLLEALDALGLIKLLAFPTPVDRAPQLPAYKKLMEQHSTTVDWAAFIDADEFLLPEDGNLRSTIKKITNNTSSIGAIAVNWASFGSSGLKEFDSQPVIKRFEGRGEKHFGVNRHYKSIVKTVAYDGTEENPHLFKLKSGFKCVDTAGHDLIPDSKGIKGLSETVCWENLRLNHYIIKSHGEFLYKKSRGRATVKNNSKLDRDINFFNAHDVNDVNDAFDPALLEKTCLELDRLKSQLSAHGVPDHVINVIPPRIPHIRVAIDRVEYCNYLTVVGWAFADDGSDLNFSLGVNGQDYPFQSIDRIRRQDVVDHIPGAPLDSGFSCKIGAQALKNESDSADVLLRMHTKGYTHAIAIGALSSLLG